MNIMLKKLTAFTLSLIISVSSSAAFAECRWKDLNSEVVTTEKRLGEIIDGSVVVSPDLSFACAYGKRVPIDANDSTVRTVKKDGCIYFPVRFAADVFGGKCEYYPKANRVYMKFNNFTIHFTSGSGKYSINDTEYDDDTAIMYINDRAYISDKALRQVINYYFFYCNNGLVICAPSKFKLDDTTYTAQSKLEAKISSKIFYERPTAEKISADLAAKTPSKQHPRLLIDADRKAKILEYIKTDEYFKSWAEAAIKAGDLAVANKTTVTFEQDSRGTILEISRSASAKWRTLCMAYLLTGDQKYVDRAWLEFKAVSDFPSWHPEHFLDVGEMSMGAALMYDWMYDALTDTQRTQMRKTLREMSLTPVLAAYDLKGTTHNQYRWTLANTNWNAVGNGGCTMAALAIADEADSRDLALECIQKSLISTENLMPSFAPSGAWMEGLMYWGYTMQFFGYYISSLEASLGTDYGLLYSPGLSRTEYYPMNLERPNKSYYRFADDSLSGGASTSEYPLFAWLYNDTALQKSVNTSVRNGSGGFSELCWYHPEIEETDSFVETDNLYSGEVEILTMRGGWNDSNALFVGSRAGRLDVNHAHSDIGSFVFDADGIEWFGDYGSGSYSWPDYFGEPRFLYYRLRSESHNMVVVNPGNNAELDRQSITHFNLTSKERGAIATMDMSKTYASDKAVTSAKRAMALINDRSAFIVRDEIITSKPSDIYWFAHTKANVTLSDDGKSAILEQKGKKLYVGLLTPSDASFTVEKDEPLPQSPQYDFQESSFNASVHKLRIHISDSESANISVFMMPIRGGEDVTKYIPEVKSIDEWTVPDGEIPHIDTLSADGNRILDYDKYSTSCTLYYEKPQDKAPVIDATSEKYDLSVTQADAVPGRAVISLSKDGEHVKDYYVNMEIENVLGAVEGKKKYKVKSVTASATPETQNAPSNLIDNNLETKWAAQGDQWAIFDLGEEKSIDTVGISWYSPTSRISPFEVEVSDDGVEWKQVYKGKSKGVETDIETYGFKAASGRFVRLNVHGYGNPPTGWNSIMEVCIYGSEK